jgi:dephospho-CoA kinase
VAKRAFADERERTWLEGVIWPLVGERITAWLEQARTKRPAPRAAVIEVPLLFEAGMEGMYDVTIAVVSSEELRAARAAGRGHALADERAARQLPQQEKANRATFVVRNDGTPEDLRRALSLVLDKLGA